MVKGDEQEIAAAVGSNGGATAVPVTSALQKLYDRGSQRGMAPVRPGEEGEEKGKRESGSSGDMTGEDEVEKQEPAAVEKKEPVAVEKRKSRAEIEEDMEIERQRELERKKEEARAAKVAELSKGEYVNFREIELSPLLAQMEVDKVYFFIFIAITILAIHIYSFI